MRKINISPCFRWNIAMVALMVFGAMAPCDAQITKISGAVIDSIASDRTSLQVVVPPSATPQSYTVQSSDFQQRLQQFQNGDKLTLYVTTDKEVSAMVLEEARVEPRRRIIALAIGTIGWLGILFLLALPVAGGDLRKLVIGADNRYSNSKFQMLLWFSVLIITYTATIGLRSVRLGIGLMTVNIPQNLLLISGLSALTFGAAKGVTTAKVADAVAKGNPNPKPAAASPNFFKDLTSNDSSVLDLGDFQMLVVTLVAVVTYIVLAFNYLGALQAQAGLTLIDVDSTILAAFGLGQGAYLTKKAVGTVGKT